MAWIVEIMQEQEGMEPVIESQRKEGSLSKIVSCLLISGEQRCQIKNAGRTSWTDNRGRKITISVSPEEAQS
jgi:hypothetical protein